MAELIDEIYSMNVYGVNTEPVCEPFSLPDKLQEHVQSEPIEKRRKTSESSSSSSSSSHSSQKDTSGPLYEAISDDEDVIEISSDCDSDKLRSGCFAANISNDQYSCSFILVDLSNPLSQDIVTTYALEKDAHYDFLRSTRKELAFIKCNQNEPVQFVLEICLFLKLLKFFVYRYNDVLRTVTEIYHKKGRSVNVERAKDFVMLMGPPDSVRKTFRLKSYGGIVELQLFLSFSRASNEPSCILEYCAPDSNVSNLQKQIEIPFRILYNLARNNYEGLHKYYSELRSLSKLMSLYAKKVLPPVSNVETELSCAPPTKPTSPPVSSTSGSSQATETTRAEAVQRQRSGYTTSTSQAAVNSAKNLLKVSSQAPSNYKRPPAFVEQGRPNHQVRNLSDSFCGNRKRVAYQ